VGELVWRGDFGRGVGLEYEKVVILTGIWGRLCDCVLVGF